MTRVFRNPQAGVTGYAALALFAAAYLAALALVLAPGGVLSDPIGAPVVATSSPARDTGAWP